eukprot:gene18238-39181_t
MFLSAHGGRTKYLQQFWTEMCARELGRNEKTGNRDHRRWRRMDEGVVEVSVDRAAALAVTQT